MHTHFSLWREERSCSRCRRRYRCSSNNINSGTVKPTEEERERERKTGGRKIANIESGIRAQYHLLYFSPANLIRLVLCMNEKYEYNSMQSEAQMRICKYNWQQVLAPTRAFKCLKRNCIVPIRFFIAIVLVLAHLSFYFLHLLFLSHACVSMCVCVIGDAIVMVLE